MVGADESIENDSAVGLVATTSNILHELGILEQMFKI